MREDFRSKITDYKALIEYYETHSRSDTANYFGVKERQLRVILDEIHYKKSPKLTTEQRARNLQAKYGHEITNVFQLEDIKNKCNTEVAINKANEKRANTLADKKLDIVAYKESLKIANKKRIATLEAKYGSWDAYVDVMVKHLQETMLNKYGVANYAQTTEFHKKAKKKYTYNGLTFDTLPELALYTYAIINNEPIIRCPERFEYIYNNTTYYYFPDFMYKGELVEIKGPHFFKKDGTMCNPFDHTQDGKYEAKHQCGIKNGVRFMSYDEYKYYVDWFKANYNINDYII